MGTKCLIMFVMIRRGKKRSGHIWLLAERGLYPGVVARDFINSPHEANDKKPNMSFHPYNLNLFAYIQCYFDPCSKVHYKMRAGDL